MPKYLSGQVKCPYGYPADKFILDCNLKLGLLKLQEETAGTSHADIDQDDVSLAGMLQGAVGRAVCYCFIPTPFSNPSASRKQVDAVFVPVQIGF